MIVRSPISTISYNTDSFLIRELNRLVEEGILYFWAFVSHLPEDDEKKLHKHVYLVPSSTIDTFMLTNAFKEVDEMHPDLPPLGCMMFVRSKFADWYLYVQHDIDYLTSKGQYARKYTYSKGDIVCSSEDVLNEILHTSDFSKFKNQSKFRDMAKSGVTFLELVNNGLVPIQQITQYNMAYDLYRTGDMYHSRRYIDSTSFQRLLDDKRSEEEQYMPFLVNDDGELITDDEE